MNFGLCEFWGFCVGVWFEICEFCLNFGCCVGLVCVAQDLFWVVQGLRLFARALFVFASKF